MKLSFSTNAYTWYSVAEAVARIARAGYRGVELLADLPHLFAPDTADSELDRLSGICSTLGLEVANINANTAAGFYRREFWEPLFEPSLAHPDATLRRWRIDYTKRCIDMARVLGAANVSVTSGRPLPGVTIGQSLDNLRRSLVEVTGYAADHGVRIGIEYEPGLLVESCEELRTLLDDLASPALGANLDLGHSHVLGENPARVLDQLADKVFHLHLEDIRCRKHYHLIPGEGDIDFAHLFRLLRHARYDGFATVELYTYPHLPDEAAVRSINHLQRIIASI